MCLFVLLLLFPCNVLCQSAERSDTLPIIESTLLVCYQAEKKGDEIKLGDHEWYLWYKHNEYVEYKRTGGLNKMIRYSEDEKVDRITEFEDDAEGNLWKLSNSKVTEQGDTVLTGFTTYYYDSKGFCYLDSSFNELGKPALVTKSAKDYVQNIEVARTQYPDGKFLSCYITIYDSEDRIIESQERGADNSISSRTFYVRDSINKTSAYFTIEEGDTTSHSLTGYNEKGLQIYNMHFTETYSNGKHEFDFEYVYNEYGDWVQKMVLKEGKLEYIVVRTLAYFN